MVWYNGGHDRGDQETSRVNALTQQWFERWLKPGHPGTSQPGFAVSRDRGYDPSSDQEVLGIATAARYPGLGGTTHTAVRLTGPPQTIVSPAGGAPASMSVLPGLGSLGSSGLAVDRKSTRLNSSHLG